MGERISAHRIWRAATAVFSVFVIVCTGTTYASDSLPDFDRVMELTTPRAVSDAQLTDQNGDAFQLSQLKGKVSLVFFGFTNCPDVCPTAMARLLELEASGRVDPASVATVLISVDGERDTPEVMKSYLRNFSDNFIGLTGEPSAVNGLAKEFRAAFFKGAVSGADGGYTVSHSPQVFVVDTHGMLRAEFYNASVDAMAGITHALLTESGAAPKTFERQESSY